MIAVAPECLREILRELNGSVECLNVQIQIEFQPPFGKALIVALGGGELHQMANTPADQVTVAFQVPVLVFRGSDDAGQGLGNRRFLGNNKFSFVHPPSFENGHKNSASGGDPNALCKEMPVSISLVSRYRLPRHCYGSSALPAILPLQGFLEY